MPNIRVGLWCLLWTLSSSAYGWDFHKDEGPADERFRLHINLASYHFSRDGQNEENYGLGFSYQVGWLQSDNSVLNGTQIAFESDYYRDSHESPGFALGLALQNGLARSLDWGLKLGLVHEDKASRDAGSYLVPYLVPYLETDFKFPVNMRLTVVPPVGSLTNGFLSVQFMVDF